MSYSVRSANTADLPAIFKVCLETGDAGNDATALYPSYPELLGERWCGGYVELPGCLALVLLEPTGAVVGYTLAALDSAEFYKRLVSDWLPRCAAKYPRPSAAAAGAEWTDEQKLVEEVGSGARAPCVRLDPIYQPP